MSSIRNSIPWCFAYDNINYARYLSSHLSKTSHLKEQHPDVHTYLKCTDLCRLQNCGKGYEDPREAFAEIDYESDNDN